MLVVGENSFIGSHFLTRMRSLGYPTPDTTSRQTLDLCNVPQRLGAYDVVYIFAAMTRFIDCEDNPLAYRVNVDAPIAIAEATKPAKIIFMSSEAVERGLHTSYGTMKAHAELGLRPYNSVIVRLSKVDKSNVDDCCTFLLGLMNEPRGLYHWPKQT